MTIKEFIEKYCTVEKTSVYMDGCYLTMLWGMLNQKELTMNDKFISFMIDHGIFHVESYKDFSNCDSNVACIGFSEKEQKWYGWSHRAIYGFGVGHIVKDGDAGTDSGWTKEYLEQHPEADLSVPVGFEVKDMEDAKRCAIAFAEAVS